MKCEKCERDLKDKYLHRHHIYPIHLGGKDTDGTLILCIRCHRILHQYLESLGYIQKETIIKFTNSWLKNKIKLINEMPFCPKCKNEEKRLFIHEINKEDVILMCSTCGYKEKSKKYLQYYLKKEAKETLKGLRNEMLKKVYFEIKEEEDESISEF